MGHETRAGGRHRAAEAARDDGRHHQTSGTARSRSQRDRRSQRSRRWRPLAAATAMGLAAGAGAALPAQAGTPDVAAVYAVTSTGLDARSADRLARALGVEKLRLDESGAATFVDPKGFLHVPTTRSPGKGGEDEDGQEVVAEVLDLDALADVKVIPVEKALALTREALAAADLLPAEGRPLAEHTSFELADAEGVVVSEHPLDTTVSYELALDGLPLVGPGAGLRVSYAGDGSVTSLSHAARGLEKVGEVPVVTGAEARERCATWTTSEDGEAQRVTGVDVVYWAPALTEQLDTLEPSLRCRTVDESGATGQVTTVPAAVDAKRPAVEDSATRRDARAQGATAAPRTSLAASQLSAAPAAPASAQAAVPYSTLAQSAATVPSWASVGGEGIDSCGGLPWTGTNVNGFTDTMHAAGAPVDFTWIGYAAWEQDFKDRDFGGDDNNWVDSTDMTYYQGHGYGGGFTFCSSVDDTALTYSEGLWGDDYDLEWLSLFTCSVLQDSYGGLSWAQRWRPTFDGLHQINSFTTVSYHSADHGRTYAEYLVDDGLPVRSAWAQASIDDQPASVRWATMGVIGDGQLVNYGDHFWGQGSVGPDLDASQVTGSWRVSGLS